MLLKIVLYKRHWHDIETFKKFKFVFFILNNFLNKTIKSSNKNNFYFNVLQFLFFIIQNNYFCIYTCSLIYYI